MTKFLDAAHHAAYLVFKLTETDLRIGAEGTGIAARIAAATVAAHVADRTLDAVEAIVDRTQIGVFGLRHHRQKCRQTHQSDQAAHDERCFLNHQISLKTICHTHTSDAHGLNRHRAKPPLVKHRTQHSDQI